MKTPSFRTRLAVAALMVLAGQAAQAQSATPAGTAPAQAPSATPAQTAGLPETISHYYTDLNLVARYSLPEERVQLMSGRRDAQKAGPRLKAVDDALKRLGQYKTVHYTMRYQWGQDAQRESWIDLRVVDPYDIERVEKKDGLLNVRVKTFVDAPREKLRLISAWDREGRRIDDLASELDKVRDYHASRTEVHTWRQVDGEWRREPANLVLLDSGDADAAKTGDKGADKSADKGSGKADDGKSDRFKDDPAGERLKNDQRGAGAFRPDAFKKP